MPINGERLSAFQRLFTDQPIAYHPVIAKSVGSVTAGVLLSQLAYWSPRCDDPDGWIYKTQADLYQETGLTRFEQEGARKTLRGAGLLEEKKAGVPAKLYFRVSVANLEALLDASQDAENQQPRMRKTSRQASGKPADLPAEIPQAFLLEPEITTQITNRDSSKTSKETPDLDQAITKVSKDLGDLEHVRSNRTRAQRMMDHYDLDEYTMMKLCQAVAEGVRPRRNQIEKPMAYFFESLGERCKSAPGASKSLAGRYSHLVRR